MQEPQKRNEQKTEKLQSSGEIRIPSMRDRKREREHGKLYRWFDNFWYHHKWKTLISLFLIVTVLVCTLQMCQREETGDISVVLAGPYSFVEDETVLTSLRQCLGRYLPADYDENGVKQVDVSHYMIYSKEQIKEKEAQTDDEGNPIRMNASTIQQNYSQYNTYITVGETSVLFLDPWLFSEMAEKEGALSDFSCFTALPEGAFAYTDKKGNTQILGVRLGDTALYRDNLAVSRVLPEDTVLCLMNPLVIGKSSNADEYRKSIEFFAALTGTSVK